MLLHNFKYTLKILLKNRVLVFWSIIWPLILGTLFYMAFSNMTESEKLDDINLGVVENTEYNDNIYLKETIKQLSDKKNKDHLFKTTYSTTKKLNKLLDDKKIDGYILVHNNKTKIVVKESDINQTIIKYTIDEVEEYKNLTTSLIEIKVKELIQNGQIPNVNDIYQSVMQKVNSNEKYVSDISNKNMDFMMIEYYTLIAMACLYGALLSCTAVKNYLGNSNRNGSRVTLAPIKRITLLISGLLASFVIQIISIAVLLLYTKFILNVDYGNRINLIILLSVIGSLAGLSLGVLVGATPFKNDSTRIGITNIIVMLGCFFAGMMGVTMKYVVDSNIPLLNKINPSNMITDGFYSLYYYKDLSRYYFDIISLITISIVFLLVACYYLRRKKYDSI